MHKPILSICGLLLLAAGFEGRCASPTTQPLGGINPQTKPAARTFHFATGAPETCQELALEFARKHLNGSLATRLGFDDTLPLKSRPPLGSYRLPYSSMDSARREGFLYIVESGGKQMAVADVRINATGFVGAMTGSFGGTGMGILGETIDHLATIDQ